MLNHAWLLWIVFLLMGLPTMAQRVFLEEEMQKYNLLISIQEHLDSLRKSYGEQLEIKAVVWQKNYDTDSIVFQYSKTGTIASAAWHSEGEGKQYPNGQCLCSYNTTGRLSKIACSGSMARTHATYTISYGKNDSVSEVLNINTLDNSRDTFRYVYRYQGHLLKEKLFQGRLAGQWGDRNRYFYEYDSSGRKTVEGFQSTASYGTMDFVTIPQYHEYDSVGRLAFTFPKPHQDSVTKVVYEYRYHEGKLASEIHWSVDDTTKKGLSTLYWYHPVHGKIQEIISGINWEGYWQPTERLIYQYYPNGLLQEYQELLKWPDATVWDHVQERRKYYYNLTK